MNRTPGKRLAIALAVIGITSELLAIALLASGRISSSIAIPLIVAGMFLAFVPMFTLARSKRR